MYGMLVVALVLSSWPTTHAANSWTQSSWSGGSGSSTDNQYLSIDGLAVNEAGTLSLAVAEELSTNGLDSAADLENWLGINPANVDGLQIHVMANTGVYTDTGSTEANPDEDVQQWNDQSGQDNHLTAPAAHRRPTLLADQINGWPALAFGPDIDSGNNSDALNVSLSDLTTLSNETVFSVGSFDYVNQPSGNYDYIYSIYNASSPTTLNGSVARQAAGSNGDKYYSIYGTSVFMGPVINHGFKLFTQQTSNEAPRHFFWMDRESQTVAALSSLVTIPNPRVTLGKYQNSTWALNGRIAEFLLYNETLNEQDRHAVENYLNNKYNLGSTELTIDTEIKRTGEGSAKVATGVATAELLQTTSTDNNEAYRLAAYVRNGGEPVDASVAELYANKTALETTYSEAGDGWYRLEAVVIGNTDEATYGIQINAGQTVNVDDLSLYQYQPSGTLTSSVYDSGQLSAWGTLIFDVSGAEASVKLRTGDDANMTGAPQFSECEAVTSGSDVSSNDCVVDGHRFAQYQITLSTDNPIATPTFESINLGFSQFDSTPPLENAGTITMKTASDGEAIEANAWSNVSTPYFSWSAAIDNTGGSGIMGYCLYLGNDPTADPGTTKGLLGTSPLDTENTCPFAVETASVDLSQEDMIDTSLASSADTYYLLIRAIDNGFNTYQGEAASFPFRFDNTQPANPAFITAPSQFIATKQVTLTWETNGSSAPTDEHSGLAGLQYRIGPNGTWYGDSHSGSQDASDLLANDGSYSTQENPDFDDLKEGNNIVYFRTWDQAGNVSAAMVTTVIKLNTNAPSSPQNLSAEPGSNTVNNFAFAWLPPASYIGSVNSLSYCYTINVTPTQSNCTFTAQGVSSLPAGAYATQPGENTIYLVAKDEAGNINYATAASATFTANTSAPGIPLNPEIADISTKSTGSWKLAVSWSPPDNVGAGVSNYRVYRSANGTNFTQIATTPGTSYVDTGLSQQTYHYQVSACDSANNCGAVSTTVSQLPTGRFTEPAKLISAPSVSISTRKATITWVTDRDSDSRVQYGTVSGEYGQTEAANSDQTSSHSIELTNLAAGTTYYYQAKWTDEDGNVGTTGELSFTTLPPPVIKDVVIRRTTLSSATLQFTSKDASQVKLYYGRSEGFGGLEAVNTSSSESTYTVELSGLDDGTTYFYKLNPLDLDGNEYDSPRVDVFTTPARPRIINLRFEPIEGEPTSTQSVTWTTNVPASSLVRFATANQATREISDSSLKTEHVIVIKGLQDDSLYSLMAESRDKDGNIALSDEHTFKTALDTRPPNVSNVAVETSIKGTGGEARGQIIVSWHTDEPATSQVAYGLGAGGSTYENRTAEDTALKTEHVVIISDLSTSQVFHIQPVSYDKSRNQGSGPDTSAIVGRAEDGVLDIIINTFRGVFGF